MEEFMEIGNPNIPTPNGLPNNDNIKTLIVIGIVVMAGIVIYQMFKNKDEKQKPLIWVFLISWSIGFKLEISLI